MLIDIMLITKIDNANGNSRTVDDVEVVATAVFSIEFLIKSPSLVNNPPHMFL
jgi:hypothetical protein